MTVLYIFLYYILTYIQHNGDVSLEKKIIRWLYMTVNITTTL